MLKMTEGVDIPLGRLEAIAQADLDRNLAALRAGVRRFAPGKTRPGVHGPARRPTRPPTAIPSRPRQPAQRLREFVVAERHRVDSRHARSAKVAAGPAVQGLELRLHRHPGPVREEPAVDLLHRAARPDLDRRKSATPTSPAKASLLFTSVHEV